MSSMLTPIDPKPLEVISNNRDILRDLFIYLDYAHAHSIKRMTRTNGIPRTDMIRLAKLLGIDPPEKDDWMYARPYWIDFIDNLALSLHLVSYDLQGEYRGYSSSDASFIDNYVSVNEAQLQKFLGLLPIEQEKNILDALNRTKSLQRYDDASFNEFFHYGPYGFLDTFDRWGSGTGIMPTLKFPGIRMFLLDILRKCPAGQWFSTESLIAYLKTNFPYFLIPQSAPKVDRWGNPTSRYANFHESNQISENEKSVPPDAPDAFERVEGRYVERFLEYIPFTMRFVDVAYSREPYKGVSPSRGFLSGFRVNERFIRLMNGEGATPKVTIQPNFDIIIESDFYPVSVIRQITTLGEQMSNPNNGHGAYVGIFQLKKSAVATRLVQEPDLDISALLKNLSGRDLPSNVQIELEEWAGHADQFTLYEGFALLETTNISLEVEKFRTEKIAPTINLVRNSEEVYSTLETLGQVPMRIQHREWDFTLVSETAISLFPREKPVTDAPKIARSVKVNRVVTISFKFPDNESFDAICKTLAELRCPFQIDTQAHIISIQQKEQALFEEAVSKLADTFLFEVE